MSETVINLIIIEKKKKLSPIIMYSLIIFCIIFFIYIGYDSLSHSHSTYIRLYIGGPLLIGLIFAYYFALKYNINHTPIKLIVDEHGFKIFYKSITRSIDWTRIHKIDYVKEFNEKIMRLNLKTNENVLIPVSSAEDTLITAEIQRYNQIKFMPYTMPR